MAEAGDCSGRHDIDDDEKVTADDEDGKKAAEEEEGEPAPEVKAVELGNGGGDSDARFEQLEGAGALSLSPSANAQLAVEGDTSVAEPAQSLLLPRMDSDGTIGGAGGMRVKQEEAGGAAEC